MRTVAVLAALGVVSLLIGCDEDKKPTETAPSATAAPASASVAATPPPAPKASPAELIAKTMKADVEAWNAHDATKVGSFYEPGGKLIIPGLPDAVGRDAIVASTKDNFAGYSDFKVAVTRTFVHDKTVVFEWVVTGKNDGPAMGQKATGRSVGVAGASVATFDDDGLIKEEHRYFDVPTVMSQLDAKAKAGSFRAPLTLPTATPEEHASKGTPEETKELEQAKALYTAFDAKKEADVLAFVTDDTTMDDFSMPATNKGTKGVKDYANTFWKAFPDATQAKPLQFAAGDFVVTEGALSGTQKGALGPVKATNKPVTMRFIDIFQMKDGKVVRGVSYADSAEILVAIGAMPAISLAPAAAVASAAPTSATAPVAAAKPK
jgi:ketosteroid isomerase-like protein